MDPRPPTLCAAVGLLAERGKKVTDKNAAVSGRQQPERETETAEQREKDGAR